MPTISDADCTRVYGFQMNSDKFCIDSTGGRGICNVSVIFPSFSHSLSLSLFSLSLALR